MVKLFHVRRFPLGGTLGPWGSQRPRFVPLLIRVRLQKSSLFTGEEDFPGARLAIRFVIPKGVLRELLCDD